MIFTNDVVFVLVLTAALATAWWAARTASRWTTRYDFVRRRIVCPVRGAPATVEYVVDRGRGETFCDVIDCSLFEPGESVDCGQVCRSLAVAPFIVGIPEHPESPRAV